MQQCLGAQVLVLGKAIEVQLLGTLFLKTYLLIYFFSVCVAQVCHNTHVEVR